MSADSSAASIRPAQSDAANIVTILQRSDSRHRLSGKTFRILEKLSQEDIKKIYFLSLNFIPHDKFSLLSSMKKPDCLVYLVEFIGKTVNDVEKYIRELLLTIKKFKLLRELGICKHKAEVEFCSENSNSMISDLWKTLFYLCEELDDDEVIKLSKLLIDNKKRTTFDCAEDLFYTLWCDKIISEENVSQLIAALEKIKSVKLVDKVKEFQNTVKENAKYPIRTPHPDAPCGLAVIVNQEKFDKTPPEKNKLSARSGTNVDRDKLENLWESFGFKTEVKNNLTSEEMMEYFKEISRRDHTDYDIFVACILSHGEKGSVFGADSIPVNIEDIVSFFSRGKNTLNGKPKLFFIQACQTRATQGQPLPNITGVITDSPALNLPEVSDILWALSTVPEYASFRDETNGSFYISSLVDTFKNYGDKEDIASLLTTVNRCIAEMEFPYTPDNDNRRYRCRQMPEWRATLRYKLHFKRLLS